MKKKFPLAVVSIFLLVLLLFATGCQPKVKKPEFDPKNKEELKNEVESKYKKIKTLQYNSDYIATHAGDLSTGPVFEAPPDYLIETSEYVLLISEDIQISRYNTNGLRRSTLIEVSFSMLDAQNNNKQASMSVLSVTRDFLSYPDTAYEGVKEKGSAYYYVLKRKPDETGDIKEIWLESENLLPSKIIREGEDKADEIENLSGYVVNKTIDSNKYRVGLPEKTLALGKRFAKLNKLSKLPAESADIADFTFDLYYPSKVPNGYRLHEIIILNEKISGTIGNYSYELPATTFVFYSTKNDTTITLETNTTSDETAMKAHLLSFASGDLDLNSSIKQIIESLGHLGSLKEEKVGPLKVYYWLEKNYVSSALIQDKDTWIYVSPAFDDEVSEQFFLDFAKSLKQIQE